MRASGQKPVLTTSTDYAMLIAYMPDGSPLDTFQWLRNGQVIQEGMFWQRFLLRADGNTLSAEGRTPVTSTGVQFDAGKWGSALYLDASGSLTYPASGVFDMREGTIEMWVALRYDGSDARYTTRQNLFEYRAANGDWMAIQQFDDGILAPVGQVRGGQWQSAYNLPASMRSWTAHSWHHIAFIFSQSSDTMLFYVDGNLVAGSNGGHYWAPDGGGATFAIGTPDYLLDEIRIQARPLDPYEVGQGARRTIPYRNGETTFPLVLRDLSPGDTVIFVGNGESSDVFTYFVEPTLEPNPPSTLLPAGTTSFTLTVHSSAATSCRYAVNSPLAFDAMTPFDSGGGTTSHQTVVRGLSADTTRVNDVYVRCASNPVYVLPLKYRALPSVRPSFPRIANLWGYDLLKPSELGYTSRLQLVVPDLHTEHQVAPEALRQLNPNMLIFASTQVSEWADTWDPLPDDWYLKDTHGNRLELWPGMHRLNLTRFDVAEFMARFAYKSILDANLQYDGCFFDTFMLTVSQYTTDAYGNPIEIDANNDGQPDDPQSLDASWHAGMMHIIDTWRTLMPHAYATGHLGWDVDPDLFTQFNGDHMTGVVHNTVEGLYSFSYFWNRYNDWFTKGVHPQIPVINSQAFNQLGYGYGFDNIPASALEFTRTYYPIMRFGLGVTLMNDGYLEVDFSDVLYGNHWWYDEFDADLGLPTGPAELVAGSEASPVYRRQFAKGAAVVNGTNQWQTVTMPAGYRRLTGSQAPKYQYIVNDSGLEFSTTGSWQEMSYHTPLWKVDPPFYHDWGYQCHQMDGREGTAQWDLGIRADGVYTIEAWWAAAPGQTSWTHRAFYDVMAGETVLATGVLDQSTTGDQWHLIAQVPLSAAARPYVRLRNDGDGSVIADALYVQSTARYNDGSKAPQVTLAPFDAVVLQIDANDPPCYALAVQPTPATAGSVTIQTPQNCGRGYIHGTAVTLAAQPSAGYALNRWSANGAGTFADSQTTTTTFTLGGDTSATASFVATDDSFVAVSGAGQAARYGLTFARPLVAEVRDRDGHPVPGVLVAFSAPATGPSGTFLGGRATTTVVSDAAGRATAPAFTANVYRGTYAVAATVPGLPLSVPFALTNVPLALMFSDEPLTAGTTAIKAVHITELRQAIDTLRSAHGLSAFSWTDPTLTAGTTLVKAAHIMELRQALSEVYVAAIRQVPSYTDPTLSSGVVTKRVHIAELRSAVLAIW
jgi:hypothetical protein